MIARAQAATRTLAEKWVIVRPKVAGENKLPIVLRVKVECVHYSSKCWSSLTLRLGTTLYSRFPRLIDQLLRGLCRNSTNMNSLCLSGFQLDLMRLLVNNDSKPAMCLGSCDQSANRYPHDLGAKERRAETLFKWQSMWIPELFSLGGISSCCHGQ